MQSIINHEHSAMAEKENNKEKVTTKGNICRSNSCISGDSSQLAVSILHNAALIKVKAILLCEKYKNNNKTNYWYWAVH